jgi:hypothetical protein
MSSNEYINFFSFLFIILIIAFFFFRTHQYQIEGMTNNDKKEKTNNTGHGINSSKLTEQLKIEHHNIKDKLNIKQHRTHYENTIIDMSDYLDGLMLNELLSLSPASLTPQKIMNSIENINKMSTGKQNLNKIMKYVDDN